MTDVLLNVVMKFNLWVSRLFLFRPNKTHFDVLYMYVMTGLVSLPVVSNRDLQSEISYFLNLLPAFMNFPCVL